MIESIDPLRRYLSIKDGIITHSSVLKTAIITAVAATNNQAVVGAVTDRALRFMGYQIQSTGAANCAYSIKAGSGGTIYESGTCPVVTQNPFMLPIEYSGYWSTTTNQGIYVDNAAAATTFILIVRYLEYVP